MKERFFDLSERLARELRAGEVLLCNFSAERSDFVRFNQGRVRQAGTVEQQYLSVRLVRDGRHATASLALSGNGEDLGPARAALLALRGSAARATPLVRASSSRVSIVALIVRGRTTLRG